MQEIVSRKVRNAHKTQNIIQTKYWPKKEAYMKRFIVCTLLVVAFGVQNHVQAQFKASGAAWGLSAGGAQGSNSGGDEWVMQYRGFLQYDLIFPILISQLGVGYTNLSAPGVYSAQTSMADLRLFLSPFSLPNLNPYLYGGFGVSKDLKKSGTDFLLMVPISVPASKPE